MKHIFKIVIAITALGSLFSCEPVEDRESLPSITKTANDLHFSATLSTTNPNLAQLKSLDTDIIPYWSYLDANGNEIGHSNKSVVDVNLPFAGKYTINFTAYTRGGSVAGNPITLNVAKNDANFFSDPKWAMLANGIAGKTWVLDMTSPIGWAGLDYPGASGDNWNWFPDYSGNEWVMDNKDWGEMYFDLNGGYNTTVKQTALKSNEQTVKKGTYTFDIAGNRLIFNNGVEMLYGGDYYEDCSNWTNVHLVELTATSMRLAVVRDQSRKGEGKCQIVYHYKVKPAVK